MSHAGEGVVVVGMACRYPDAASPQQLWEVVSSRRQAFRPLPPERLPLADYGGGRDDPDRTYVREAAVLEGWRFDRARFQVPGALFRASDLTHWLALEVAGDALADAGVPGGEGLDRSRVGVVLGNSLTGEFSRAGLLRTRWPYVRRVVDGVLEGRGLAPGERADLLEEIQAAYQAPFPEPDDESLAGGLANTIAGRICNHFDFHGAGYTVDGACASSLLAVAHACHALERGDLDLVLAGGVDLSLDPFELVGFARLGALADGPMRVYDRDPTGFLPGEGCGILALAREPVAAALGLRPYARIAGAGVSADGAGGLTRPEASGQRLALDRAHRRAGFGPDEVALVEGHGTGTAVGDQVELEVLAGARSGGGRSGGAGRSGVGPAALGSVKANIGHTKAAAGAAGLLKAVLAAHHQLLPPTTGCVTPHPLLASNPDRLRVLEEPEAWPDGPRRAAVCSAGFGGVNTHVLVEGAAPPRRRVPTARERSLARPGPDAEVVALAAAGAGALRGRLAKVAEVAGRLSRAELADLAVTLARSLPPGPAAHRAALVAATPEELAAAAAAAVESLDAGRAAHLDPRRGLFLGAGPPLRVGLLFSGQGAPVRPTPGALGALLDGAASRGAEEVGAEPPGGGVADTAAAQPAIVRASLLGLHWLDRLGVEAAAALGHSLGELTALHWAGAFDEGTVLEVARVRGETMSRLGTPGGAMAAVNAAADRVAGLIEGTRAELAAINAPDQAVVSGPAADVTEVIGRARRAGLRAAGLPTSGAFHSRAMAAPAAELGRFFAALPGRVRPRRTVISSVTGSVLEPDADLAGLLHRQLTAPVRFAGALAELARHADLLVEVGPGEVLAGLAAGAGLAAVAMDAGAPSARGVATVTAALFAAAGADASAWAAARHARPFDLDRERSFLANPCERTEGAVRPAPARPASPPAPRTDGPPSIVDLVRAGPAAAVAPAATDDPLEVVVGLLARAVELDASLIRPETRLLGDLHLTSLRVAQLAGEAAERLGKAPPAGPLSGSGGDATVRELAEVVSALPDQAAGPRQRPDQAAGVGPWVRAFVHELIGEPPDMPPRPAGDRPAWRLLAPDDHPLRRQLETAFAPGGERAALLLALPPGLDDLAPAQVVEALRRAATEALPLVVLHHGGIGAAVGRSLTAEHPDRSCLVIECEPAPGALARAAEVAARLPDGHRELRLGPGGAARAPRTRLHRPPARHDAAIPLGEGDVCLVSGGAKGIGAECALALARATGARLALLGRGAEDDPEVATTLARAAEAGVVARYLRADVTDPDAVAAARELARAELGPIRALLHCAGRNQPARIEALTAERLRATLAPKADGLRHLLAGLDPSELRLLVTFGSVIGRVGLAGESDYAIANEWLARRVEELAAELPGCRCVNIEWSVWAGGGMGERLGALDALRRQGVEPIAPGAGVEIFLRLLADPDAPANVMVAGRMPPSPTLRLREDPLPLSRFLETPLAHTPGVELVAEATLSSGADPYLADHAIDGVELLPAVMGLEAMAQAAAAVLGTAGAAPARFEDVRLEQPITVPSGAGRVIRLAALAADDGRVECVLRSADSGFAVDHFRARLLPSPEPAPPAPAPPAPAAPDGPPDSQPDGPATAPSAVPAHPYYGSLFFHGPRFARLAGYDLVSASRCVARIAATPGAAWFGGFHAQGLLLGDPGARDAAIHVLQACVPHRRVVPVAVESIRVIQPVRGGEVVVRARERSSGGGEYVFDLVVEGDRGKVHEEWQGLRLREIGAPIDHATWPADLLAAHLARRARALLELPSLDLAAGMGGPGASVEVATALLGDGAGVRHAPDGRLLAERGAASASHLGERLLVAVADRAVAVDWDRAAAASPEEWRRLLGPHGARLAEQVAARTGEPPEVAAARVWACREAIAKRGLVPEASPPVLEGTAEGGWLLLRAGEIRLASLAAGLEGDGPVAVAVAR